MVLVNFLLRARCEGISSISLDPDYSIYFSIQCGRCGTAADNEVYLALNEESSKEDTRGTFNFIMKVSYTQCKFCSNSITIKRSDRLRSYNPEEENVPLVTLDIRGAEIPTWFARKNFIVRSETDKIFEDVDFSAGDWCEYDDDLVYYKLGCNYRSV